MNDLKHQINEAFYRDTGKRRRGRPRKSTEEKKHNRAMYWRKWRENMTEEQKKKRRKATRKSHDEWYSEHKEDWAAYMRRYRKRKKEEQKNKPKQAGA